MNRAINRHLSKVVFYHQRDWDQYFSFVPDGPSIRSKPAQTPGENPPQLKFLKGRGKRGALDPKNLGYRQDKTFWGGDYARKLRQRMDDIQERVRLKHPEGPGEKEEDP
ncbi:hypothetical protein JTB14_012933 [Gonioctena quinquepunctata]|nr:hypothetical protein JTB14_012933 [Gonioctena quinquepunctata]